ncbi:MAG: hypothetical protein QXP53_01980 [Candidatus Pacearchaeota archaeon]
MNKNLFLVLAFAIIAMLSVTVYATGWQVTGTPDIKYFLVYVNGEPVWKGNCTENPAPGIVENTWTCTTQQLAVPAIERGEQVTIKAVFFAGNNLNNVIVHAWLRGSGRTIEDETRAFDVYAENQYTKWIYLSIPENWKTDGKKEYTLHVEIEGENRLTGVNEAEIDLDVQRVANLLDIVSINLEDSNVKAGNALEASVVVKNTGNHELEDVYVKATIKELGISKTVYLGDLAAYDSCNDDCDEDDTKAVTISLIVPKETQAGVYTLTVEAYNEETSSKENVGFTVESGTVVGKVEVTPQTTRNNIIAGESATYSILVTNNADTTKRFAVAVFGTEGWATSEIMPASFSLAPGESKLVSITLHVEKDAIVAEHLFSAQVSYDNNEQRFNFIANVTEAQGKVQLGLKDALLIVGIILAAIIVILLIVLLTRKSVEEKPEESYY